MYTMNQNTQEQGFSPRTKIATPCRTGSYYHLFKQGGVGWGDEERDLGRERDFVNAITLLMARRILTKCGGSLKGICKFNRESNCRWQDVFPEPVFMCKESSSLRERVKHDAHYRARSVRG